MLLVAALLALPAQNDAPIPGVDAEAKTRLAVMALSGAGVPPEYAEGLTETLATATTQTGIFEVISPRQLASLLAYEKRKELLGGCVEEQCYLQVANTVKAEHLVAGSVAQVGGKLVLNLVLIDATKGVALKRVTRETVVASELMAESRRALTVLLQPILSSRQGYLKIAANVADASLIVDDEMRKEGVGQVIALAAGPHVLKVKRDGFYAATADIFVRPGKVSTEDIKLIPARETIERYEGSARMMRYGAYGTAAVAVASGVLSGLFYARASDNKTLVDRYTSALDIERPSIADRAEVEDARGAFSTNQALYFTFLGTAVVSGGVSLVLFILGDDPDRYQEFHSMSGL